MRTPFVLRILLLLGLLVSLVRADDAADFAAVKRADQQRIVATIASDTAKLATLLSDDLNYGHSDGRVQTKPEFLAAVGSNRTRYLSVHPQDVVYQAIAPGAVAAHGRAYLVVEAGGQRRELWLRFLAVWREEAGAWRLLTYQSTPLPAAAP